MNSHARRGLGLVGMLSLVAMACGATADQLPEMPGAAPSPSEDGTSPARTSRARYRSFVRPSVNTSKEEQRRAKQMEKLAKKKNKRST